MDRLEFFRSINPNQTPIVDLLSIYFDQFMILYDLIDSESKIEIVNGTNTDVSFKIENNDPNVINALSNNLQSVSILQKYEKMFRVTTEAVSHRSIVITMIKQF